jgi:hypothetical protein
MLLNCVNIFLYFNNYFLSFITFFIFNLRSILSAILFVNIFWRAEEMVTLVTPLRLSPIYDFFGGMSRFGPRELTVTSRRATNLASYLSSFADHPSEISHPSF